MQFSSQIASFVLLVAAAAHARPLHSRGGDGGSQCDTGPVQCCNSVQPAGSKDAANALGALNIPIQGVGVPIGLTCNPINIIGVGGGANCAATPVCCENNDFGGAVAIGCTPVNLGV